MEMEMQYDVSITLTPLLIYFRHLKKKEKKQHLGILTKQISKSNKQTSLAVCFFAVSLLFAIFPLFFS